MSPVTFVTGASSGIGEAIAVALGADGHAVGVGFHSGEDRAAAVVERIEAAGGRGRPVGGNMSDEADVASAFDAVEEMGPLTNVVVNAGVQADAAFADMTLNEWRKVMAIDLDGAFLCAREAVRRLMARDRPEGERPEGERQQGERRGKGARGSVLFVTSVHAWVPWAGHVNYAAAKGGVDMLMQSLAQEVAGEGIRVNAIAPGAIRTAINEDVWGDEAQLADLLEIIPYGRMGESEEVAEAARWLLSPASDYVVGTTLTIDGGISLYPAFVGNG